MPSATLPSTSDRPGHSSASCLARLRTSGVSSSSRHGGAHRPDAAGPRLRWSATRKNRISSMVSPKNSIRTGCSSVGGNTSRMPPRTARSPRFSTSSVRAYPISTRWVTTSSRSAVSSWRSRTGSSSPRPADHGLEQAAHRGGDDRERAGPGVGRVRVSEPAQHREPLARGVGARRQPLVRERLPRREVGRGALGQQRAERRRQVLGLASGRGHGQHESAAPSRWRALPGAGQRGDEERPQCGRRDQVAARRGRRVSLIERAPELWIIGDDPQKSGEAHRS